MRRSVVAIALLALACGGGDDPSGPFNPIGTYALRSFNGQPIPATIGPNAQITEGALVLEGDLDYSLGWTQVVQGESSSGAETGQYTITGASIGFIDDYFDGSGDDGPHYFGTFSADGRTVTVTMFDEVYVFRR